MTKGTLAEVNRGIDSANTPSLARPIKLRLKGVSKLFRSANGNTTLALQDINFDVRQGEFVCIVGPTGCGKTTLLNIVAGLEKAGCGDVLCNGRRVKGPGMDRIVMFQESVLFPWLTARKNIEIGLKSRGLSKEARRAKAMDFLRLVHLSRFADAYPHELSGGMRQRVALARSLAMDPEILLMDEPFTALDAQTRWILHYELQSIWEKTGKTILFVTHNLREAVCLADRVIVLSSRPGRMKQEYKIDLPRPRDDGSVEVAALAKEMMELLRGEIEKVMREELDEGSCTECEVKCVGGTPGSVIQNNNALEEHIRRAGPL
ncbi:MAG: ABC transporter ATP-binding protein [Candidatus Brocadiales bacterium]|nr:ABC transporter ATP-binding protein [Candidatus Brocadiales bacterium]